MQDAGSGVLTTIEDFMWYKLALVRPSAGDGPSTSGYFSGPFTSSSLLTSHHIAWKATTFFHLEVCTIEVFCQHGSQMPQRRPLQAVSRDARLHSL